MFWGKNPLDDYEKNKILVQDWVSKSHEFQDKVRERLKITASDNVHEHYTRLEASLYVFSEEELKELINKWQSPQL